MRHIYNTFKLFHYKTYNKSVEIYVFSKIMISNDYPFTGRQDWQIDKKYHHFTLFIFSPNWINQRTLGNINISFIRQINDLLYWYKC